MISFSNWKNKISESSVPSKEDDISQILKLAQNVYQTAGLNPADKDYVKSIIYIGENPKLSTDVKNGVEIGQILGIIEKHKPQAKTHPGYIAIKKRLNVPVVIPSQQPIKKITKLFAPVKSEPKASAPIAPKKTEDVTEVTPQNIDAVSKYRTIMDILVPKEAALPLQALSERFKSVITPVQGIEKTFKITFDSSDPLVTTFLQDMINIMISRGINYEKFLNFINEKKLAPTFIPDPKKEHSGSLPLWVYNDIGSGATIKLPYLLDKNKTAKAENELKWLFYNEPEIENGVNYKNSSVHGRGIVSVNGKKLQFFNSIRELKKLGFDTSELQAAYDIKSSTVFANSKDQPEIYDQIKFAVDSKKKEEALNYFKDMVFKKIPYLKTLQKLKESGKPEGFALFPKQWEGIAHLYSRTSAINGDETGVGKTNQFLIAAKLRMIDSGKKCLIVTMSDLKSQLLQEISKLFGPGEDSKVSFDEKNPKDWTVVNYETFQSTKFMIRSGVPDDKKIDDFIKNYIGNNYEVMVLDEAHKVKIESSIRSYVIGKIAKYIPIKYNITATLSANKPIDIKNQLAVVGHNLGKMSTEDFQHNFIEHSALIANSQPFNKKYNLYNKKVEIIDQNKNKITPNPVPYEEALKFVSSAPEGTSLFMFDDTTDPVTLMLADRERFLKIDRFIKAQNMNKLLHTTGVYDKKTKQEINPKLKRVKNQVVGMPVNKKKFCRSVRNIVRQKMLFDKLPTRKNINLDSVSNWLRGITMPSTKETLIKNFQKERLSIQPSNLAANEYASSTNDQAKSMLKQFGVNDANDYAYFYAYVFSKGSTTELSPAKKQETNITTIRRLIAQSKVPITVNKVKQLLLNNADHIKNEIKRFSVPDDKMQKDTKIVVFTNFKPVAKQLISDIQRTLNEFCKEQKMPKCGLEVLGYYGDITDKQLEANKLKFKTDPKVRVIVMTMQKGGTGIDFPNIAKNMIINDVFYTPESADQAEGRIYRINTMQKPEIYYPVAKNIDLDKKIFATLKERRKLASVIQNAQSHYIDTNDEKDLEKIKQAQDESESLRTELEKNIADQIDDLCKDVKVFEAVDMSFRNFIFIR